MNQILLDKLVELEGYDSDMEMLEEATFESIVPGICENCFGTQNCEPDARKNWCDECQKPTVQSCLVIAGII